MRAAASCRGRAASSRIARCEPRLLAGVEVSAGRAGSMPARQSASSTSRLPSPAIRAWSISTAFTGARLRRHDRARAARSVSVERVDAEPVLVGVELDRTEPARVAQRRARPPSAKRSANRCHAEHLAVARVDERVAGRLVVDEHPAAHAEVQAEHRARVGRCRRRSSLPAPARRR